MKLFASGRGLLIAVSEFVWALSAGTEVARADETRAADARRVPLLENFSVAELAGAGAIVAANTALFVFETPLESATNVRLLESPWKWDVAVSNALYRGPDAPPFMGGVPGMTGLLAPPLALAFYTVDSAVLWTRGTSLSGDKHADHKFVAFVEALGSTMLLTQSAKVFIKRERPLYALGRQSDEAREDDATMSFFSMHTSSAFCVAAFVSRDVSDWLVREHRFGLLAGRLLPGTLLYGAAALVGVSRVVEQKHYATDSLTGALVGAALGNAFYALHFDGLGRPRGRAPTSAGLATVHLTVIPGGLGLVGTF